MSKNDISKEDRRLISSQLSDSQPTSVSGTYSVEEALNASGTGWFQWLLLIYVGFATVCDAMEMMLLSFLAPAVISLLQRA